MESSRSCCLDDHLSFVNAVLFLLFFVLELCGAQIPLSFGLWLCSTFQTVLPTSSGSVSVQFVLSRSGIGG